MKVMSLLCNRQALVERLTRDIKAGVTEPDILARSIARIPSYESLNTIKIDVSDMTPEQPAIKIR